MPGNDVIHPIYDRWGRLINFDFCSEIEPTETRPYMTWIDPGAQVLKVRAQDDSDWLTIGGSGGGGAPADAQYLVLALDGDLSAERRLIAGDGLQANDAGPNGDYTLAAKVSDFAGTGLENDGANNLRIAAAAAGDGLTGGGGSALAVNTTVVRTSGNQTIAGVKTLQHNLVLDDGIGDSPQLQFVGGSHDDTAYIYLANDTSQYESTLRVVFPPGAGPLHESFFSVQPAGGGPALIVYSDGNVKVPDGQLTVEFPTAPAGLFRVSGIAPESLAEVIAAHVDSGLFGGAIGMAARYSWHLYNDYQDDKLAAAIDATWTDPSAGSEDADLILRAIVGGLLTEGLRLTAGKIKLPTGTGINEFSTDGTLAGNSDNALPTEKAVKTYVDAAGSGVPSGLIGLWDDSDT
jgi:hypothetical protein